MYSGANICIRYKLIIIYAWHGAHDVSVTFAKRKSRGLFDEQSNLGEEVEV